MVGLIFAAAMSRQLLENWLKIPDRHHWAWLYLASTLLFSFCVSYMMTPLMIYLSFQFDILDYPDSRKQHARPTPLLGGLGIFLSFILTLLWTFYFPEPIARVLVGSALIVIMGMIDDARELSAKIRMVGQLVAALIVVCPGADKEVVMTFLPHTWWGKACEYVLTVIWIVGITNSLNFLDGMDGLATGLSCISLGTFLYIALETSQSELGFVTAALLGSCLAFLSFNFKPASVFLGDSGSTFLGFVLASLAVIATYSQEDSVIALSIPLLILGIIIYDVIFITVHRIKRGDVRTFNEWLEYTGHDHLHHRLSQLGLSQTETVLFIYLLAIFMGVGAIVLVVRPEIDKFLVLVMALIVYVVISVLMELGRSNKGPGQN